MQKLTKYNYSYMILWRSNGLIVCANCLCPEVCIRCDFYLMCGRNVCVCVNPSMCVYMCLSTLAILTVVRLRSSSSARCRASCCPTVRSSYQRSPSPVSGCLQWSLIS